ncbi:MAG: hypothetical protein ACT4OJ_01595 [Bacteroidota bacterium]
MKKIVIAFAGVVLFSLWYTGRVTASANTGDKVTICHREGNGSSHSITVSIHAVLAHLAHVDAIGNCDGGPAIAQ